MQWAVGGCVLVQELPLVRVRAGNLLREEIKIYVLMARKRRIERKGQR